MKALAGALTWLKSWRVYLGRAPVDLPPRSLVIFPATELVLSCGLAGILAIKKHRPGGAPPDIVSSLEEGLRAVRQEGMAALLAGETEPLRYLGGKEPLAELERLVLSLKEEESFLPLVVSPEKTRRLAACAGEAKTFTVAEEKFLEDNAFRFSTADIELLNSRQVLLRDIAWALEKDVLENIGRMIALAGGPATSLSPAALKKYAQLNYLLNSLDRLEVRGRDSAGIQISVTVADPGAWTATLARIEEAGLQEEFLSRTKDGDLVNGSIHLCAPREGPAAPEEEGPHRTPEGLPQDKGGGRPSLSSLTISFVYKTASVIGELGRNVRELRESISRDRILRLLADLDTTFSVALAHTRWASVGSITEENCHPINNHTRNDHAGDGTVKSFPAYGRGKWSISVVLNGDIDNYRQLRRELERDGEIIAPEVTTDTKIIPLAIERHLQGGCDVAEAFRRAVSGFEGSHAIAMFTDLEPGKVFLALRGSGQSIYVGLAADRYLFSSELYGLVEGTPHFLKMDGETPTATGETGQIFILDEDTPGGPAGIRALSYGGTPLTITPEMVRRAEITTRDIDRGEYPHYFLKEINEAGASIRKTLRGKYLIREAGEGRREVSFNLGADIIPETIRKSLADRLLKRIIIIGHGTAAVAGKAVADAFTRYTGGSQIKISARVASELSGFDLAESLADTLVIPITQSGTTTDTNRAVAMAAERGAGIIAIVNRRQSDITSKSHGVFYTSDGRDIEMSVASTKAFYSQIVAGHILALCFAQLLKTMSDEAIAGELDVIASAPRLMEQTMAKGEELRRSAEMLTRRHRYWAVVGSGPNKAAADEIRIKLSELCYKTISSDIVENKKHIDLSAEPLIIVCAAGSPPAVAGDIVKDVAIFRAHKASTVVFADEGEERFDTLADTVIALPRAPLPLPVILNTAAGHLWGYYAARSIDGEATFLREFRSRMNRAMNEQGRRAYSLYDRLFDRQFRRLMSDFAAEFQARLLQGSYSQINARTVANIVLLLKYAVGKLPLEDFWLDFQGEEEFSSPLDLLDVSLGHAIDELSRPIDAIRHQAKTVTVGTSRREEALSGVLFTLLRELGFTAKALTGKNIMALKTLQPAVAEVRGYSLYRVSRLDAEGHPDDDTLIEIIKREGIAARMSSRAEGTKQLLGSKRTIVRTGHVYAGFGRTDGATIIIIPLLGSDFRVHRLLLLHVSYREDMTPAEKREALGYRYNDLRNLVNEYNLPWKDGYLQSLPMATLLGETVEAISDLIRKDLRNTNEEH